MGKRIITLDDEGPVGPRRNPWDRSERLRPETVEEYFEPENEGAKVTRGELKYFLKALAHEQVQQARAIAQIPEATLDAAALQAADIVALSGWRGRWMRTRLRLREAVQRLRAERLTGKQEASQ